MRSPGKPSAKTILTPERFGALLLETGDLDPVYIAINGSGLELPQLQRWCLVYWLFYHVGVASKLSEIDDPDTFWLTLWRCACSSSIPRGTERRHFRGRSATNAVEAIKRAHSRPEDAVRALSAPSEGQGLSFSTVSLRAQSWPMFGPWIAFKVADMLEQVLGVDVDWSGCELDMYSEPVAGAKLIGDMKGLPAFGESSAYSYMLETFGDLYAPPRFERKVGLPEIETILCKYKAHVNGHYPVGKDTKEVLHALAGYGETAARLHRCLSSTSPST